MNKTPFFSIVIPVYNKEPHIARSINSILNQTFTDFEIIIVCDPSTDNSNSEVAKFTDSRIRVFSRDEPGPGGYAARNLGIKEAKTDWIAFLDADDEWYPEHLSKIKKLISECSNAKFFAAGFDQIDQSIRSYGLKSRSENYRRLSFKDYLSFSPFYTSTVVASRSLLIDCGLFPEGRVNRGGDVDTWLRAIENAGGYVMANYTGAKYYRDSENMVTRQHFYTEAEIKHTTIKELIKKYESPELKQSLMVKLNNQVIYAWNQNMHLKIEKNFSLYQRLFFKAQPLKVGGYLVLSVIPNILLKPLHAFLFKVVSIKRRLAGS